MQDGAVCGVKTANGPIPADAVILATGGCSYPLTGSTGDGYRMAAALGHTVAEPVGSLVPLVERGHDCAAMQGPRPEKRDAAAEKRQRQGRF